MIANVLRAYTPSVEYKWLGKQQESIAALQALDGYPNRLLPLSITPSLIHRKVWVWLWSISGTWAANADLVFESNKREVFRQKILDWTTASVAQKFVFCYSALTASYGTVNEQMIFQIAGSTTFGVCPHRLNIAADTVYISVNSITGAAALFDFGLHIQGQAGL